MNTSPHKKESDRLQKIKALLSKLTKAQIIIIAAIAACAIVGGMLLWREWDARRPMDFSIPEPVASATDITDDPVPTSTQADIPASKPGSTGTAAPPPSTAPTPETSKAPSSGSSSASSKALTLKEDETAILLVSGKKIAVKRGVDEVTLKKHVGWMESSAAPGETGVCVLMGHRDRELKHMKNVMIGSELTLRTPEGDYAYTVYAMDIIEKDTPAQIPATTESELMIVTCYPFYYSGSAPQQIVIMARR